MTVIVNVGKSVAFFATNWKPESTPVVPLGNVKLEHGAAKVD